MTLQEIQPHGAAIRPYFCVRDEVEYHQAVLRLNALIDEVGDDEEHPLYEFLDTLGAVIQLYEEKHYPMPKVGSQGVVSEILKGWMVQSP